MFAGLDDIDWASMNHAYGAADEVPDILRGLVSTDPSDRETALDDFYGAVHHQGDVYECTLAAVPFLLEAAANKQLPGRGPIVGLLASIGETDIARRVIADACPLFLELLADPDPEVRRAVPKVLRLCESETALKARFNDETDPEARIAIVTAVGGFGRSENWLSEVVATQTDAQLRFTALAELARCSPTAEVVPTAIELLREVYAAETPPGQPAGFTTDTLIGQLRELREQAEQGRTSPDASELVRSLSVTLDDRVEDRIALLTQLLTEPNWEARYDALRPASVLMADWRGDYHDLVRLIGDQLVDSHPRLPGLAAETLEHLGRVAAPAADALAQCLDAAPREAMHPQREGPPAWITLYQGSLPTVGPIPRALAELRDPRVLPVLRWALEHPNLPGDIGSVIGWFGSEFVPVIRRRLRDLPTVDGYDRRRSGLIHALGRIGPAAAEAVPELLELPPNQAVMATLGRIGPDAAEAIPTIRATLQHGKPDVEITAAVALWRVTNDPALVLPVLTRHLDSGIYHAPDAAQGLAELGPIAAETVPKLRGLLRHESPWIRLRAAQALWRIAGDTEVSVLTSVYTENVHTRLHVAQCLAEMGSAAEPAVPLMRAELSQRQRHRKIEDDVALLHACDTVLNSINQ